MRKTLSDAVGLTLFTALFAMFVVQIVARFAFNRPLPWTDELAVILYIWVILWAGSFMVPAKDHVAFDLLLNLFPPHVAEVIAALGNVLVGALAAWAMPATWDYVQFMRREGTPVLGIPFMAVFFPFVLLLAMLVWRGLAAGWSLLKLTAKRT